MRKHEAEVNAYPFGHSFAFEGKEVVGFEREMDRFGERKFHTKVWVDKEKGLFVHHSVRFRFPIAVRTIEDKQR